MPWADDVSHDQGDRDGGRAARADEQEQDDQSGYVLSGVAVRPDRDERLLGSVGSWEPPALPVFPGQMRTCGPSGNTIAARMAVQMRYPPITSNPARWMPYWRSVGARRAQIARSRAVSGSSALGLPIRKSPAAG